MIRKVRPEYSATHHFIKPPESLSVGEGVEEEEPQQRRQQLINFGHSQWGFNNWSWAVTKQDLDFVELSNGAYCAGVVSFVSISVKSLDLHYENIGYATARQPYKGAAIHSARKCAVTNALRETLLSFGGSVATELLELLDAHRNEQPAPNYHNQNQNPTPGQNPAPIHHPIPVQIATPVQNPNHIPDTVHESNQNAVNKLADKNVVKAKKEEAPSGGKVSKNMANPPVATAHPIPVNLPPMANRPQPTANVPANTPRAPQPAPLLRPNSNEGRAEDPGEEEARAERKRRQRQAQEEFRLKQLMKQKDLDDNQEQNTNSSLDALLMAIPTQDSIIEEAGNTAVARRCAAKRSTPAGEDGAAKRRSVVNKLDVVEMN